MFHSVAEVLIDEADKADADFLSLLLEVIEVRHREALQVEAYFLCFSRMKESI